MWPSRVLGAVFLARFFFFFCWSKGLPELLFRSAYFKGSRFPPMVDDCKTFVAQFYVHSATTFNKDL